MVLFQVDSLLHCYLETTHCKLFNEAFPYDRTPYEPSSAYVGVARSDNVIVTFTQSSLALLTGSKTDMSLQSCNEAKVAEGVSISNINQNFFLKSK